MLNKILLDKISLVKRHINILEDDINTKSQSLFIEGSFKDNNSL